MFKSLLNTLCKIGTIFKFSTSKSHCQSSEAKSSSKSGVAAATSGDNSPIFVGGHHTHNAKTDTPSSQFEIRSDCASKFKNILTAVAHELPYNFRHRGNFQNPFITQALEKLVHDEPMIHGDHELFLKANHCLKIAQTLSTAQPYHPTLKPAQGQRLMKDLADYIASQYGIEGPT